jgi:hypothetical protein
LDAKDTAGLNRLMAAGATPLAKPMAIAAVMPVSLAQAFLVSSGIYLGSCVDGAIGLKYATRAVLIRVL